MGKSKFNINKIFPFLPLKIKLIIAFAMLSSIPLLIVGIIGISNSIERMREIALENLSHDVSIYNERAQNFITNINTDISYIINNKTFSNYFNTVLSDNNDSKNYSETIKLDDELLNFAIAHKIYFQFRFIDSNGDERFRLQNQNNRYKVFSEDSLSNEGFRFYFNLTKNTPDKSISIIPDELLGPFNGTTAAISFVTRVYNSKNQFEGIFVADVYARELFKVLEQKTHLDYGKELAIVNNEGHYLYNSDKKKNWNKLLAYQISDNIFTKYSKELSAKIVSGKTGIVNITSDEVIAYTPLFLSTFSGGNSYFIFESVNQQYITDPAKRFAIVSLVIIVIFLIISVSFAMLATNQIARPIQYLKKGAEIISKGNYSHRLSVQTNDEIEQLAKQFNKMAEALGERDILLKKHREELEKTVVERTKELKSEKEKLQVILDNVPSAFILMDEDCKILSASEAIKSIALLSPDELIGKNCSEILNDDSFCRNCQLAKSNHGKGSFSLVDIKNSDTGSERYIEHFTIPLTIFENKKAFLEILTDITERKKTEEHLLKLQKLITIGETSALIAHEIRNSLTSIKMFLQLQKESSTTEEDRKVFDLSLNSIQNIEKVVNNLLSLGHNINYNLSYTNLNSVVGEAIDLLQPQITLKKISINQKLDADMPSFFMDADQIKESIINLLLNSIQALNGDGIISIITKRLILEKEISDYGFVNYMVNQDDGNEYKIKLKKGEKVVFLEIDDNGNGISQKNIKKIYDPFFTTKEEGTGLGLSMVKRTINSHNGIIKIQSEKDSGTKVKLYLPLKENI